MAKLVMMVGISYSGKSTIAKKIREEHPEFVICSSDEMRKRLYGDEGIQKDLHKVFEKLHKEIREYLKKGQSVIYDATCLSSKRRVAFLKSIEHIKDVKKCCIIVATPLEECIRRIKLRDRVVPEEVIWRQVKSFSTPYYFEGWDEIYIYKEKSYSLEDFLSRCHFSQESPHHSLYCDEHMKRAYHIALDKRADIVTVLACRYHDLGKFYTKTYVTQKGECDGAAHYYGHQSVSAYLILLGEFTPELLLHVSVLCGLHMDFFLREEKGMRKLKELIGEELYKELEILHECDVKAH